MLDMIVDIHAHLDHKDLVDDLDRIIADAKKAGVVKIFTSGINPYTNRKAIKIASKYDIVEASLGIYPLEALQKEMEAGEFYLGGDNKFDVDEEIDFIRKQKPALIGEVGMDRAMVTDKDDEQRKHFKKMIELAEELKVPVLVHSRKAELDCIETLETFSTKKVIMHCFSGKKKYVKRIVDNGWMLSMPPIVVRAPQFQIMASEVPIRQLLTETDAPYLSPFKDQLNEPAFIVETVKKIAEIKGMEKIEVEKSLFMNYQQLI